MIGGHPITGGGCAVPGGLALVRVEVVRAGCRQALIMAADAGQPVGLVVFGPMAQTEAVLAQLALAASTVPASRRWPQWPLMVADRE
jgi:hypothetical protein